MGGGRERAKESFHSSLPVPLFTLQCLQNAKNRLRAPHFVKLHPYTFTAAGLALFVERLTAEREVAGSIPRAGPILRDLT